MLLQSTPFIQAAVIRLSSCYGVILFQRVSNGAVLDFLRGSSCSTVRKVVINRLCYLCHIPVTHISDALISLQTTRLSTQPRILADLASRATASSRHRNAAQVKALACRSQLYRGCWSLSAVPLPHCVRRVFAFLLFVKLVTLLHTADGTTGAAGLPLHVLT